MEVDIELDTTRMVKNIEIIFKFKKDIPLNSLKIGLIMDRRYLFF